MMTSEFDVKQFGDIGSKFIDLYSPLYDWCFVTHIPRSNRRGGLYVPDNAREDIQFGTILGTGRGLWSVSGQRIPLTVKVGDKVLWAKHWEKPIDLGRDEHCAAVREKDIIGIVRPRDGYEDLEPLYNTIVIDPDPLPEREGSLWLPPQYKKDLMPAMHGTVISCGPGHLIDDGSIVPLSVKPGDRVCYEAFGGEDHRYGPDGKDVRLIPEEHVLAILD